MVLKVISLALVFAATWQQGHGHDHAYSSQHVAMHHGKHIPVYYKKHDKHGKTEHRHDFYAHPKYKYDYKIKDHHTGDEKSHHETRHGDAVKGTYSLHEPDGRRRVVHYKADKHTGFHASVKHEGHAKHIIPKKHKKHHDGYHDQSDHYKHEHSPHPYHGPVRDSIRHFQPVPHRDTIRHFTSAPHYSTKGNHGVSHKHDISYLIGDYHPGVTHQHIVPHGLHISGISKHKIIPHRSIPHFDGPRHYEGGPRRYGISNREDISHHDVPRHGIVSHHDVVPHHDIVSHHDVVPQHNVPHHEEISLRGHHDSEHLDDSGIPQHDDTPNDDEPEHDDDGPIFDHVPHLDQASHDQTQQKEEIVTYEISDVY